MFNLLRNISAQRTAHSAQRTAHSAQRTAHSLSDNSTQKQDSAIIAQSVFYAHINFRRKFSHNLFGVKPVLLLLAALALLACDPPESSPGPSIADGSTITTTCTKDGGTLVVCKDASGKETKRVETLKDGSTITTIGGKKALMIHSSVSEIGKDAYKDKQLTSVSISASLGGFIDQTAFAGNSELKKLTISGTGAIKDEAFKEIFDKSDSSGIALVIANGITSIGNEAFLDNKLTSVVIPPSVTSIGDYAFQTNELTSVVIGNSVKTIGAFAFSNNKLTSVVISPSVTSIGVAAFSNNQLTSVVIPLSVTSLGVGAFSENKLASVVISKALYNNPGSLAFERNPDGLKFYEYDASKSDKKGAGLN